MMDFAHAREVMVDCQVRPSDVTRYALIDAMLHLPRELFVPRGQRDIAYAEVEVPLGEGRVMLPPRILAKMIEAADIDSDNLVMIAGSADGYGAAVVSRMAEAVIGVEQDDALRKAADGALAQSGIDNVALLAGNPSEGDAAHAPFDAILVNGAVEAVPDALLAQLKDGGRLVAIMLESGVGSCITFSKRGSAISRRRQFDATAPLLDGFAIERGFSF